MRPGLLVTSVAVLPVFIGARMFPIGEHNYLRAASSAAIVCTALWFAALRGFRHPLWLEIVDVVRFRSRS
jgi:hypothetical protein